MHLQSRKKAGEQGCCKTGADIFKMGDSLWEVISNVPVRVSWPKYCVNPSNIPAAVISPSLIYPYRWWAAIA